MIIRKLPVVFGIVLLVAAVLTTYAVNQPEADIRGPDGTASLTAGPNMASGDKVIQLATDSRAIVWDNGMNYVSLLTAQIDTAIVSEPADDFIFDVDQLVNDVHWIGGYWMGPPDDGDFDWKITFYNDVGDGTSPGNAISSWVFPNSEVNETYIEPMYYSYSVDLPTLMTFMAGQKYWISIQGIGYNPPQSGWGMHQDPILLHEASFRSDYFGFPDWTDLSQALGYPVDMCFQLTYEEDTCNWQEGDPHKMHFPQLPDTMGWDVNSTFPIQLADDWECSETGWVQDIHFWGGWRENIVGEILQFNITIYDDIPADQSPTGYSMPGGAFWFGEFPDLDATRYDPETPEGWYDPMTGEVMPSSIYSYWQYDICLDEEMQFWQDSGVIYWVSIQAILYDPEFFQWGWKSTDFHWNDDAVWDDAGGQDWRELYEPGTGGTWDTLSNPYGIILNNEGWLVDWYAEDYYGEGWYYYEWYGWWNIWFYDHPYDPTRYKTGWLDLIYIEPWQEGPFYAEIAVNWSTDLWSLEQPPSDSMPPLPGVDEDLYIGRQILFATDNPVTDPFSIPYEILEYNPEWVSIDVRGFNFVTEGILFHECRPKHPEVSLDLAFVITGEAPPPPEGACCDSAGNCFIMVELECNAIGGLFEGAGTTCDPNPCDTCDFQFPGDFDDNGMINVEDMVGLVQYLYQGGPPPPNPANADPSGDCCIDWRDVKALADSIFGGAPLADCTCRNPEVCIDPPPDHTVGSVFHNVQGWVPNDGSPYSTNWHELYPDYCTVWDMVGWEDNGDGLLSFCDTVYLARLPADTLREHVIKVMPTLTLVPPTGGDPIYVDLISPDNPFMDPDMDYWGSLWHEVYPNYCRKYQIVFLSDIISGHVYVGDEITLQALNGPDSAAAFSYTVVNIETDMITEKLSCCRYRGDINHDGAMGGVPLIDDLVYLTTFMFQGGPCDAMCDDNPAPGCNNGEVGTLSEADVNGDGSPMPLIDDLVWLTTYMFQDGPEPVGWIDYTTPACED